ncbi:MAG TPA: hypothetical protein VFM57_02545 [Thermoleophilaceae bacterium]|nr:hypothetical protein [Thermoleophilaceae bacterium]
MASSPRDVEREEERRLNMRTLTIASAASAAAAAVTSQLWIAGTWIAAALTPVLVALISEALHRPTERVARARTTRRAATGRGAAITSPRVAEPDLGPIRVYRQPGSRPSRRRIALGVVAATGALAFVIGIVALTTVDLVSGGSVGKGSGRTTLLGGGGDGGGTRTDQQPAERGDESTSQPDEPTDEPTSTAPTSTEPPEDEPSDTAPLPEPTEPAPGEPEQPAVP